MVNKDNNNFMWRDYEYAMWSILTASSTVSSSYQATSCWHWFLDDKVLVCFFPVIYETDKCNTNFINALVEIEPFI